jgi:hypothetical protein
MDKRVAKPVRGRSAYSRPPPTTGNRAQFECQASAFQIGQCINPEPQPRRSFEARGRWQGGDG